MELSIERDELHPRRVVLRAAVESEKLSLQASSRTASPSGTGPETSASSPARLESLDALRGIAIAGMIIMNNPGDGSAVYGPLRHADWNGWTAADLVFPLFIFIMGVAEDLSLVRRRTAGMTEGPILSQVVKRSLLLFGFGLLGGGWPFLPMESIRLPGVLQRIALCYLISFLILMKARLPGRIIAILAILLGYWGLMEAVPVPGYGAGNLTPEGNLASFVDRKLMGGHLLMRTYDPEGLLSTLPAVATALLGGVAAQLLRLNATARRKSRLLMVGGAGLMAGGWLWGWIFPINKTLWTSSYALFTAGIAALALAICYHLIETRRWSRWAVAFRILGMNSILAFFLSGALEQLLKSIRLDGPDGAGNSIKSWIFKHVFLPAADPINASLLYAVCSLLIWLGVMTILYRRKYFLTF
ncbi:MAG: DUF1624 domain-containing protein [Acidobacteria bacterium]|nr:DUF1624 domain-containing protein [Acidobacteriota bacterium]